MKKSEALEQLKVSVLGSEVLSDKRSIKLLETAEKNENGCLDISVFIRIQQKKEIDDKLFVFLAKQDGENYKVFSLAEICLNPSEQKQEKGYEAPIENIERLKTDEYHIIQNCRFNFYEIPKTPAGTCAIVVSTKDRDLSEMLDAYYFRVE